MCDERRRPLWRRRAERSTGESCTRPLESWKYLRRGWWFVAVGILPGIAISFLLLQYEKPVLCDRLRLELLDR